MKKQMNAKKALLVLFTWLIVAQGCGVRALDNGDKVYAKNIESGQVQEFPAEEAVPEGWSICPDEESCPGDEAPDQPQPCDSPPPPQLCDGVWHHTGALDQDGCKVEWTCVGEIENQDVCPELSPPAKGFCADGMIEYDVDEKGCRIGWLCLPLPAECRDHGEIPIYLGPGKDMSAQCCPGLEHVAQREYFDESCDELAMLGYYGICIACGDGTCDTKVESECNCPEDCAQ